MSLLDTAAGYAWKGINEEHKNEKAVRQELQEGINTGKGGEAGTGYSPDVIHAALNLATYGVLGPDDRKTAESYGLLRAMRPEWFTPHKGK